MYIVHSSIIAKSQISDPGRTQQVAFFPLSRLPSSTQHVVRTESMEPHYKYFIKYERFQGQDVLPCLDCTLSLV